MRSKTVAFLGLPACICLGFLSYKNMQGSSFAFIVEMLLRLLLKSGLGFA